MLRATLVRLGSAFESALQGFDDDRAWLAAKSERDRLFEFRPNIGGRIDPKSSLAERCNDSPLIDSLQLTTMVSAGRSSDHMEKRGGVLQRFRNRSQRPREARSRNREKRRQAARSAIIADCHETGRQFIGRQHRMNAALAECIIQRDVLAAWDTKHVADTTRNKI